ncbi:hypothetical protein EMIT0P265_10605 [Pseudomonas zeae]
MSLLAIAVCQLNLSRLTHRYREQAHSYRGLCDAVHSAHPLNPLPYIPAIIPATLIAAGHRP